MSTYKEFLDGDGEKKWQDYWEQKKLFAANDFDDRPKYYALIEFPYPSAEGLHVGHPRSYTALDIVARKRRMQGFNVLYPIGFDAFGLPAENFAIKTGTHPKIQTDKNIDNYRRQLKSIGFSFDWDREVNTTDPKYYKWTQWIFLQLFKHGLAYKAEVPINFCTSCKVGLANEEVVGGNCERCGGEVVKKIKSQWMLKITDYAQRLDKDLDQVDFLEKIKIQQRNWIGKSEGAEVDFAISGSEEKIKVYTTRPDTLFGATYMVLSPEHELVQKLKDKISNFQEVENYLSEAAKKSDLERTELNKEKTGVELKGIKAINPVNNEEIPIWISDYVLAGYGTGAIMAVPAHDERDFLFALKYNLPIIQVVESSDKQDVININIHDDDRSDTVEKLRLLAIDSEPVAPTIRRYHFSTEKLNSLMDILKGNKVGKEDDYKLIKKAVNFTLYTIEDKTEIVFTKIFTGDGVHINSDFLNGLGLTDSLAEIINWLEKNKCGKGATIYKLRDWVFSRQRYWGEPIPLVFCENCKNKKQKALLIHGFEGTGDGNWFAWIKQELEKAGFEVFNPTMTTSEHPVLEQWFEELMPFVEQMGEDDIIVGHSLGAKAALHLIEKAGKKFKALYLVAPVLNAASDKEYDLLSEKWQGSDIDLLKKFSSEPYDFRKISDLVESKNVIFSDDDPYIRVESKNILPAGWNRQVWNGFGHFQNKEISELLNLISKSKNTGWVALPEIELPLVLPEIKEFQAGDDGESPLSKETKWVATTCLKCGGSAKRETDTMPQWAGSSWYFLRYIDPQNNVAFADEKKLSYWTPIDWYNGGMEHTTLHLLYSRFWHKFLFDLGYAPTAEPYAKRTSHGMVLGEGSEKMSKSRGNVVNPDQVIKDCGADTLRMYEMFMGPFDQAIPWDTKGVLGVRRFLEKVWLFFGDEKNITKEADEELERVLNKTIKKVGEDIETMHFNTAVSAMMILVNKITEKKSATKEILEKFLIILSPFAPHLTEELWGRLGHQNSIALEKWPAYDKVLIKDEQVEIVVQVNGKVRAKILVSADISEGEVVELAGQNENVKKYLEGQQIKKTVFVPGKLISFVV